MADPQLIAAERPALCQLNVAACIEMAMNAAAEVTTFGDKAIIRLP
jgi:hypothetical protein